jgi:hypothetical protein
MIAVKVGSAQTSIKEFGRIVQKLKQIKGRDVYMKKFIVALGVAVMTMVGCTSQQAGVIDESVEGYVPQAEIDNLMEELRASSTGSKYKVEEPYMYVVTEVYGDEINGLSITNKTSDNGGVVLSYEYNNVPQVETGDIVMVEYGEAFDDVVSVEVVDCFDLTNEQLASMPTQIKSADGERHFLEEDGSYSAESIYYQ